MSEENIETQGEEKKEDADETPPTPETLEPTPPTDTPPEEPCDPLTMSCDEMKDKIISLSKEVAGYDENIKKINEVKEFIPSEGLEDVTKKATKKVEVSK